ncbi:MAG TPA: bis-aminopropyl spermidine synthase family protein, partial [Acidimicrobiia bacterium]
MPDVEDAVARLRAEWGLDFARVRRVLAGAGRGESLTGLVTASGLPRRDVEMVLAALPEPFPEMALESRSGIDEQDLTGRMEELAKGLPPSRWGLDHVPATPDTMARRAQHLAGEYELGGASVLCLGDHDLTSLAVGSLEPGAELSVVDIDEPILDHIGESAAGLGLTVTSAWADLRLALPPSLTGSADLVFTDPPYTTEGMRLFLGRALEALRPTGHERIAFCFGTGERHLVKALEVQGLLGELRLALEAMLPGFNRYTGAEAIGARSDLYICRPTKGARVGEAPRRTGR